jgi:hypothetical protein
MKFSKIARIAVRKPCNKFSRPNKMQSSTPTPPIKLESNPPAHSSPPAQQPQSTQPTPSQPPPNGTQQLPIGPPQQFPPGQPQQANPHKRNKRPGGHKHPKIPKAPKQPEDDSYPQGIPMPYEYKAKVTRTGRCFLYHSTYL